MTLLDMLASMPVAMMPPPSRTDEVLAAWPLVADRFDYSGTMPLTARHDLAIVADVVFEVVEYAGHRYVEAEGVIVAGIVDYSGSSSS